MFRSCQIIIRELCSLLKLYYGIHNSILICKRGVVAAYHVVWECVVERWLGVRRIIQFLFANEVLWQHIMLCENVLWSSGLVCVVRRTPSHCSTAHSHTQRTPSHCSTTHSHTQRTPSHRSTTHSHTT